MALIKCPECKNSVSSLARICPHCGIKLNNTQWGDAWEKSNGCLAWIIIIALIIALIGLFSGCKSKEEEEIRLTIKSFVNALNDYDYEFTDSIYQGSNLSENNYFKSKDYSIKEVMKTNDSTYTALIIFRYQYVDQNPNRAVSLFFKSKHKNSTDLLIFDSKGLIDFECMDNYNLAIDNGLFIKNNTLSDQKIIKELSGYKPLNDSKIPAKQKEANLNSIKNNRSSLTKLRNEVADLFIELMNFKDNADFYVYGFSQNYKYYAWLESIRELKSSPDALDFYIEFGFSIGDLLQLGIEYNDSKGQETKYSIWARNRIQGGLRLSN